MRNLATRSTTAVSVLNVNNGDEEAEMLVVSTGAESSTTDITAAGLDFILLGAPSQVGGQ